MITEKEMDVKVKVDRQDGKEMKLSAKGTKQLKGGDVDLLCILVRFK